jgi:hypothetical protein
VTAEQLTLTPLRLPVKPSALAVWSILEAADGAWVSGVTLNNRVGFAYSQRIGELIRAGYPVERAPSDGGVQRYRMARA